MSGTSRKKKRSRKKRESSALARYRGQIGLAAALALFLVFVVLPEKTLIPVAGAGPANWTPELFWDCPWCTPTSKHMGIDIIMNEGTPVLAATHGVVLYNGWLGKYGRAMLVLSPALRVHLYGHLFRGHDSPIPFVRRGQVIGLVGNTGLSDCPHLHYTVFTLVPHPWRFEWGNMGWLKTIVLNPHELLMRRP